MENKIYTEKRRFLAIYTEIYTKKRQFLPIFRQFLPIYTEICTKKHQFSPIFRVKSVKIYTGQKNLHWRRQPRQWQLSGMWNEAPKLKLILDMKALMEIFEKHESFEYMDWSCKKWKCQWIQNKKEWESG